MPKSSSLTLSLSQEQAAGSSPALGAGQQSPIRATGDVASNAQGQMIMTDHQLLRENLAASDPSKMYSHAPRARKPVPASRPINSTIPNSTLEAPPRHLHPYRNSPGSSVASMSHGNLLETASVTSGSVIESVGTSDQGDFDTGFKSNSLPRVDADQTLKPSRKPNKQVFQQIMSRSRSIRQDNGATGARNVPRINTRGRFFESSRSRDRSLQESPRTAPIEPERGYREAMESKLRNRSADRTNPTTTVMDDPTEQSRPATSRFATLMNNSSKAAGDLGRVGKGFFGKFARSGSSNEREPAHVVEVYEIKIISLPLVEQTRLTRIRQRMSDAKDKTEFWLPALPYRCIDYLNLKGCDAEGLYRIPGSLREIKHWQARFDTEHDINLLDVVDLDDVNTVGSLLKSWLRDQPDELVPRAIQKKISEACGEVAGKEGPVPQMFKDELSKLPPFNYYLLFAITAHLALLQKHSDVNKMDYRNLCICFQPCMNIEPVVFYFLVKDWRNCWQGCWSEKEFLEEEYRVMSGASPSHAADEVTTALPSPRGRHDVSTSASDTKTSPEQPSSSSPHRPPPLTHASRVANEAGASGDSRKPPPAPQSSPQLPQTPTSPSIDPVTSVSPLRM